MQNIPKLSDSSLEIDKLQSSIFLTSSNLRDILSLVFLLLSLPQFLSITSCILYLIISNIFGKRISIKSLLADVIVFFALNKLKKSFTYFIILSNCIISSDLIGSKKKSEYSININAILVFIIVNYLNYLLKFNNPKFNPVYLLLSVHIINQSIFKKTTSLSNQVSINVDENKLLDINVELKRNSNTNIALKNFENFIGDSQPFWSIIAAIKAVLKNPNLFNGETTKIKNDGGKLKPNTSQVAVSVVLIDSSKIVLHCNESNLSVKLNNVNWQYYKECNNYLIIHGLTPLFQYEIDIIKYGQLLNHLVVNTNDENQIINKSVETSSLLTLQTSLTSTMNKLNNLKVKYKKMKKDENKRINELKNQIEVLKGKISKNNKQQNDNRIFGKIKGLKHSVIQLENEITDLAREIEERNNEKEVKSTPDNQQQEKINQLNKEFDDYETRSREVKLALAKVKQELQNLQTKQPKLINKQTSKQEEVKQLQIDLKNIKKNEIISKFQKRVKSTNEKFETILPRIIRETESLQKELY
ncbi:unnamed protein product [Candida verbasci]|uniref:Uncharacterized protein n=1 Tax=Candida verbasci TaxID=1227364 RepID=A0A9W4TSM4_9ASCO|nr:unnamed protein product [Candida verbasci]